MQAYDHPQDETSSSLDTTVDAPEEAVPARDILGNVVAAAREYARKERLFDIDGGLMCWNCKQLTEWHVSLHCQFCRDAYLDRRHKALERYRKQDDEKYRWARMGRNMLQDSRLNRELGLTLLNNARKLPSATPERVSILSASFDERFKAETSTGSYQYQDD